MVFYIATLRFSHLACCFTTRAMLQLWTLLMLVLLLLLMLLVLALLSFKLLSPCLLSSLTPLMLLLLL